MRRAVLSRPSGKDCAMALHLCRRDGLADVVALLTTVNETFDRVAIHGTQGGLMRAQAAAGLPLTEVPLCPFPDRTQSMRRGWPLRWHRSAP
ncbi:MAG: hypothetical protein WAT09_10400 [Paracoccaceae bacterium]